MFEHRRELTLFAGPERLKPAPVATHAAVMAVAVNQPPSRRSQRLRIHAAPVERRRIRHVIARLGKQNSSDSRTDSADFSVVFPLLPPCLSHNLVNRTDKATVCTCGDKCSCQNCHCTEAPVSKVSEAPKSCCGGRVQEEKA